MNVFVLFAHPEPTQSFQAALLNCSLRQLEADGHSVQVSNLYEMGFNPVASAADFGSRRFPERLQYDREQKHAVEHGGFAEDIQTEIDKVLWCDLFIVQFPMYWFSMPAIMKGWFDRVFVNGQIYGAGRRFEAGGLSGRKAMICTSTGGPETMFQPDGILGDIEIALWPIHNGIFGYVGLETLPPFIAWGPVYSGQKACDEYLVSYEDRIRNIAAAEALPSHPSSDFDTNFRLKPGVQPRTTGHRLTRR